MAIRDGLLGNPVLSGLLARGGPVAIQQAANQQIARMQQRPQAARLRAPGAINLPPDNSVGQGLSQLGKALGDIADIKEQGAAKKDLADLFGQTTTVQEPGTGQTASVPRTVTSGDIYKLMGKYINNPSIQKSLSLQAKRLELKEREERDRQFRTSEREASQNFRTGERIGSQDFRTGERKDSQKFQTGEREGGQNFRTGEREESQNFKTSERVASQEFKTGERQAKEKSTLELQLAKQQGVKGTLNQVHFANGVVKSILRENNQDFIINDDGKRVSVQEALRDNKGAYIAKPEDFTPSATQQRNVAKATQEVGTAEAEVKTIGNIVRLVKQNADNVGFAGDIKASLVNVGGILQDIVGENKFTEFGVALVGGQRDKTFLNNLDSRSEKLKEAMLRLRQRAKGRAATANEIKEITALTNLRQWAGSEKLTANIEEIERRLKEDLGIITKSNADAGLTESPPPSKLFTWSKK